MTPDQSHAASAGTRMLTRKPVLLAAAALIATSALGLTLGNNIPFAVAETPTSQSQTVQTPAGPAPISFADLVQKVSPAVVSINVKGDAKVAENDLPICPRTIPSTTSSSSSVRACRARRRSLRRALLRAQASSSRPTALS